MCNDRSFLSRTDGSIPIIFAFVGILIILTAGAAIDFNRTDLARTTAQDALDAAVLAAAKSNAPNALSIARSVFEAEIARSSFSTTLDARRARFNRDGQDAIVGRFDDSLKTLLLGAVAQSRLKIGITARAQRLSGGACIYALSTTLSPGLLMNAGAKIDAPDCSVEVHSTADPAATFNAATELNTDRICVAGSRMLDNGGIHPNLAASCAPLADPFSGRWPEPNSNSCDVNAQNYNSGVVSLTPGVYCGNFNFNASPNVNFAPGLYVIKGGDWNVNGGDWSGLGVTFYFADSSRIQFNSAVRANLSAPAVGAYKDAAFIEKPGLPHSPFVFDDSRGFNIAGVIYLPSRDVIFNSSANLEARRFSLVANSVIFNNVNWNLSSLDGGGGSQLVRLSR